MWQGGGVVCEDATDIGHILWLNRFQNGSPYCSPFEGMYVPGTFGCNLLATYNRLQYNLFSTATY